MNDRLLFAAYLVYDSFTGLRDLLTKPPVSSLLLERPPLPPGYVAPKTLVLNVSGTIVHSEYKVSNPKREISINFYTFAVGTWLRGHQETRTQRLFAETRQTVRGRPVRRPGETGK